jgi:hypothetical protein
MSYTSLNFIGNSTSYLSVPSTFLSFGTGDFTVECWVNFNSVSSVQSQIGNYLNSTTGWTIQWR